MYIKSIVILFFIWVSGTAFSYSLNEMKPVLPENEYFQFGHSTSNQITVATLKHLDKTFFEQTAGENQKVKDRRNTGTLKLILMVNAVLHNTHEGRKLLKAQATNNNQEKDDLAEEILVIFLTEHHLTKFKDDYFEHDQTLNVDQVAIVADLAKKEIFEKLGVK